MFNWLKKLFGGDVSPRPTLETYTPPTVNPTLVEKPKTKSSATTGRKSTGGKKGPKKTGVTKTDLNKMTKDQLETYAKKEFKIDIDKRRKKADLVEQLLKLTKKNG